MNTRAHRLHSSTRFALPVAVSLALLLGAALTTSAKKAPPAPAAPDCSACAYPAACKDIKRCVKSCNTAASVAFQCLKTRRISETVYTEATGRAPDDFDAIVDEAKTVEPEAKPGDSLPEQLTMDQVKKGMSKVDFSSCAKEGGVKAGQTSAVMVRLTIDKSGKVSDATCAQINDLSRCVLPKVKTATFPPFGGMPMKMTYPVLVR